MSKTDKLKICGESRKKAEEKRKTKIFMRNKNQRTKPIDKAVTTLQDSRNSKILNRFRGINCEQI
jgi:hypothetical protein